MLLMFFGYVIEFKKLSEVSLKCGLPYPKSNKPFPFNFLVFMSIVSFNDENWFSDALFSWQEKLIKINAQKTDCLIRCFIKLICRVIVN